MVKEGLYERDWVFILELIYKMNCIEDITVFQQIVLERLGVLIPYTKSVFFLASRQNNKICSSHPAYVNVDSELVIQFIDGNYDDDEYFKCFYFDTKTKVFRDTDMISEESRLSSNIFKDIYSKEGIYYALRAALIYNDVLLGYIALFRPKEQCDFSSSDLKILSLLAEHFTLRLSYLVSLPLRRNVDHENEALIGKYIKQYDLTKREAEISCLIKEHIDDAHICRQLCITSSTFHKHINNIYKKLRIKSRAQLMEKL